MNSTEFTIEYSVGRWFLMLGDKQIAINLKNGRDEKPDLQEWLKGITKRSQKRLAKIAEQQAELAREAEDLNALLSTIDASA